MTFKKQQEYYCYCNEFILNDVAPAGYSGGDFLCCLQQIFLPVPVSSFGTVLGSSHSSSSSSWQTATHLHKHVVHSNCHIVTTEMTSNGSKYAKKQKISRSPKRPPIRIIKHVELQVREHHKYRNYHTSHELKCGVPSNQAHFPPNKKKSSNEIPGKTMTP